MATDLHKGVLSQILLKNDKMTESSNFCQSFKITAKALKLLGMKSTFLSFVSELLHVFLFSTFTSCQHVIPHILTSHSSPE